MPHQFLDLLGKRSIVDVHLGDHIEKNMVVLFSDIRGFTHISENLSPDEAFQFMNDYLLSMEPIIIKHGGFIDKYIGDAIMALFEVDVDAALKAAIEMQKRLAIDNDKHKKFHKNPIRIGIGINYGPLMLGTLGGSHRIETSVLGDAVNLAARLEKITKNYNSSLLIADDAYKSLKNKEQFHSRFAGFIKLEGKVQETGIWEIYDADPEDLYQAKMAVSKSYNSAINAYYKKHYDAAVELFQQCLKTLPDDIIIKSYISDCQYHITLQRDIKISHN